MPPNIKVDFDALFAKEIPDSFKADFIKKYGPPAPSSREAVNALLDELETEPWTETATASTSGPSSRTSPLAKQAAVAKGPAQPITKAATPAAKAPAKPAKAPAKPATGTALPTRPAPTQPAARIATAAKPAVTQAAAAKDGNAGKAGVGSAPVKK